MPDLNNYSSREQLIIQGMPVDALHASGQNLTAIATLENTSLDGAMTRTFRKVRVNTRQGVSALINPPNYSFRAWTPRMVLRINIALLNEDRSPTRRANCLHCIKEAGLLLSMEDRAAKPPYPLSMGVYHDDPCDIPRSAAKLLMKYGRANSAREIYSKLHQTYDCPEDLGAFMDLRQTIPMTGPTKVDTTLSMPPLVLPSEPETD